MDPAPLAPSRPAAPPRMSSWPRWVFLLWALGLVLFALYVSDVWRGTALDDRILYTITEVPRIWLPLCSMHRSAFMFYPETKPLWSLLGGGWAWTWQSLLRLPPNTSLRILDALLAACIAWVVFRAGLALGFGRRRSGVAALLVMLNPLSLFLSVSGHTTTLFTLLVSLATLGEIRGRTAEAASWSALSIWVRPEGFIVGGAWVLAGICTREPRKRMERIAPLVLSAMLYALTTYLFFGRPFGPDMGYDLAKIEHGLIGGIYPTTFPSWAFFRSDLLDAWRSLGLILGAASLPLLAIHLVSRPKSLRIPAIGVLGILAFQVLPYVVPFFAPMKGRYIVPCLPVIALCLTSLTARPSRRIRWFALILIGFVLCEDVVDLTRPLPPQHDANRFTLNTSSLTPFDPAIGLDIVRWVARERPAAVWVTYDAYPVLLEDPRCLLAQGDFYYGPNVEFHPGVKASFIYADLGRGRTPKTWPKVDTALITDEIRVFEGAVHQPEIRWSLIRRYPGPISLYRIPPALPSVR